MSRNLDAPGTPSRGHILDLATEQLISILKYLEDDPTEIKPDRRAYLSQESFSLFPAPWTTPSETRAQDLGSWRLVCKRFSDVGAVHQFARVSLRFSANEFKRLDNIASQPHLASAVKKFSYLVPCFYYGTDRNGNAMPDLATILGEEGRPVYLSKLAEQRSILESRKDLQALQTALSAFKGLQQVQILPVLDEQDKVLFPHIRNVGLDRFELHWAWAVHHCTKAVSEALIKSASPCTRFSSPRLNPQTAIRLVQSGVLQSLAAQLTCLELHFDDGSARLDPTMRELSPGLRTVFHSAAGLESVHIGFPSPRPIELGLEEIFGNMHLKKLVCFGIQGWKLDGEEIVRITERHRFTLRGLRLRDVLLKGDSRWKDVLGSLQTTLRELKWCSLRRIGYAAKFDADRASEGGEIPDDPPDDNSESSDEELLDEDDIPTTLHTNEDDDIHDYDPDAEDDTSSTYSGHSDDEHNMATDSMEFPEGLAPNGEGHATPDTSASLLWPNCNDHPLDLDNAGVYTDNGIQVDGRTRKVWEKWVICKRSHSFMENGRC